MKFDVVGIRLVKERTIEYETSINSPQKAVEIIANEIKDMDREMMMSVNLNVKGQIINAHVASMGGIDFAPVDVKNILKSALLSNANGIMIFHNHPSGMCYPSKEDQNVTNKIKNACKVMDIKFLDHVVLGEDQCYSFSFDKYFEYPSMEEYSMNNKNNEVADTTNSESVKEAGMNYYHAKQSDKERLFHYYENGEDEVLTESDLLEFYENEFDEEQKKLGTNFEDFIYDSIRAGILIPFEQEEINNYNRRKENTYIVEYEINDNWDIDSKIIANMHLSNYGKIFCYEESNLPIDDISLLEEILEIEMPEFFEEEENQDEGWCV